MKACGRKRHAYRDYYWYPSLYTIDKYCMVCIAQKATIDIISVSNNDIWGSLVKNKNYSEIGRFYGRIIRLVKN
jgi:hypothetical protein